MKAVVVSLVLLLLVGVFMFIAVDKDDSAIDFSDKLIEQTFSPAKENVKLMGRSYFDGVKRYFSFSGSGVEFQFKGKSVTLEFLSDDAETTVYGHQARFAVLLDGVIVYDEVMDKNYKTLIVNTNTDEVPSVIRIVKLSEAKHSSFALGSITVNSYGSILPTEENDLKIEFIGDSLTCGYGIDDTQSVFSTRTENFMKTYAYITAQNLCADYSAVSFSGYGVVSGFTAGARRPEAVVSRYYYDACLMQDKSPIWNFNDKENNLVVINLGANDASYCTNSYRVKEYYEAYIELIKMVRSCNPDAHILCALADVNNSLFPTIERAVEEYKNDTLDNRISTFTIEFNMDENDVVVDGHPGYLSNLSASNSLTNRINELIALGEIAF